MKGVIDVSILDEIARDMQIAVDKRLEKDGFAFINDILEDIEFNKRIGIEKESNCNFVYLLLSESENQYHNYDKRESWSEMAEALFFIASKTYSFMKERSDYMKKVYRVSMMGDGINSLDHLGVFSSMKKVKDFIQKNYPSFKFDPKVGDMYFDKEMKHIIWVKEWEVQ